MGLSLPERFPRAQTDILSGTQERHTDVDLRQVPCTLARLDRILH